MPVFDARADVTHPSLHLALREPRRFRLPPVDVAPLRVLVVDDDRDVAKTLARTIERLTHVEAVVATSRAEAFDMACEDAFDAALVDLGLEQKGLDLLAALRDMCPATVRVVMSAWPDESVAVGGAVRTGAQAYVLKPWDTTILLKTLDRLLAPRTLRIASGPLLN